MRYWCLECATECTEDDIYAGQCPNCTSQAIGFDAADRDEPPFEITKIED